MRAQTRRPAPSSSRRENFKSHTCYTCVDPILPLISFLFLPVDSPALSPTSARCNVLTFQLHSPHEIKQYTSQPGLIASNVSRYNSVCDVMLSLLLSVVTYSSPPLHLPCITWTSIQNVYGSNSGQDTRNLKFP
jgi:hypothetical protein